jgi:digeranylgeranylglycerophospholipid reductase
MRSLSCDVLVVGAGPVGSVAARTASECGADVLLLEEHPEVGSPVFCAEGISLKCVEDSGLEAKPPLVCHDITETRIIAPDTNYIELVSPKWSEFIINRDFFDRALSEKAVKSGVRLMTNTRAITVTKKGDTVTGVMAKSTEAELKISAKVVVGADGHASIVRKTSGLSRWFSDVYTCAQFKIGGLDLNPQVKEILLGGNIAPGGYAWVFPKSREVANVGLGVRRIHKTSPIEYLKRYVDSDARFKGAEIQRVTGGICPASGTLSKIVDNGVMVVGDAAGQLMPLTGAGVQSGIEAGRISGEVAAQSVEEGDVSASRLSMYERRFDGEWGERIRNSRWGRDLLDRLRDEDLNRLPRVISGEDLVKLANGHTAVKRTIVRVMTRSPGDIISLLKSLLFPERAVLR